MFIGDFDVALVEMDENTLPPTRARVPISHRFVPSLAFGLTAVGGILGAWWTLQLFQVLKYDETVTAKKLMDSLGSIEQTVGMIYGLAVIISVISIVVTLMRSDEEEATMPGIDYLVGLPSLVSPAISAYAMYLAIDAFHRTTKTDFAKLGGDIASLIIVSVIAGGFALVILLPFVLLPFTARVGKRFSPIIVIGLVAVGIITLVVISFWLVGYSQEPTNPLLFAPTQIKR